MRLSSLQRWLFEAINILLVLTFMIPVSILVGFLFGMNQSWMPWLLCLSALGYVAGRATMHANVGLAQLACFGTGGLTAAVCGVLLQFYGGGIAAHLAGSIVCIAITGIGSIAFFFCSRKAGYTVYAPMALMGILIHLVTLVVLYATNAAEFLRELSSWTAIVFFLLSLYAFNARGLRKSVYTSDNARSARLPRGIQMSSFLLVSVFILIAAVCSLAAPVFPFLASAVGFIIQWVFRLGNRFLGLIDELTGFMPQVQDTSEPLEDDGLKLPFDDVIKGEAAWVTDFVSIFAIIVVSILGVILLVLWYQKFLKNLKVIQNLLARMQGMFNPTVEEDYVDETESLFSWGSALRSATEGLRNAVKKFTDRPQKFDDFQNDRLKIRFVYQQLLKRRQEEEGGAASRYETPNELQSHLPSDAADFIEAYNGVRYADTAPDPAQVAQAKALLSRK